VSERQSDPRRRPSDPAGTQPKVDPESLRASTPRSEQPALPAGVSGGVEQAGEAPSPPSPTATLALDHATVAREPLPVSAAPAPGPPALAPRRQTVHPHAPRFQFLFGVLGALGVAALVLLLALLHTPAPTPVAPWSTWQPSEDGIDPAQQIANHVAPQYRLDNGRQIVQVTGGPPALRGQPLTVGVVRSGQSPAALEGNDVLYQLCGDGANCSIKAGKPSVERGLLLSREALELALYTFRYISGVDQVIVTIPPPPPSTGATASAGVGGTTSGSAASTTSSPSASTGSSSSTKIVNHAILFRQQDVAFALDRPLSATLSTDTPRVSQMNSSPDATLVEALTGPRLYDYLISETQQSGPIMLLEPPSLGG
jgi:hypothetical protein